MPFFKKELSKAITAQTKLRNIFLQNRGEKIEYVIQNREIFVSLFKKKKKNEILWKSKWNASYRQ